MAEVNGGDLVVRTLAESGVRFCFTIVGGHNFELVNACQDHGIRVIDVRHEQQAVHMADGIARFSGSPALATVDGAPGLVNAVPGLEIAYETQVPLYLMSAQGSLRGRDIGVMQAIDQLRLVRSITKWQRTCFEIERLPEYTATAIRKATTGRPGPVFLDMPLEVLRGKIDETKIGIPRNYRTTARPFPDPALVCEAAQVLAAAKKPIIIAGSGCFWAGAGNLLRQFVEETGIPILTRNLARGMVPEDLPQGLGMMPTGALGADAYLILGTRLDWTIGYGRPPLFAPEAKAILVDLQAEEIGKTRPADVGIVADCKTFLEAFIAEWKKVQPAMAADWPATAQATKQGVRQQTIDAADLDSREPGRLMHSIHLSQALAKALPRDAITIVDGGYIAAFALQILEAYAPAGVTWVGSTGHLGVGVPFAVAAKLAQPNRPAVTLMGDGSFGLTGIEFDTAVRHNIPIVVIIANDSGWGETRDGQRKRYGDGRVVGTDLSKARYDLMAEAFGGHGELVETAEQIGPALDRALASGKPAILNVLTDPHQRNTLVSGMPWIIE